MSQELIKQHIEAPQTLEKFSKIFGALHKVQGEEAKQMFEVEKFHFMRTLQEKGITDVTPVSAMGVFLEVTGNRFSFSSAANHVYLMTANVKVKEGNTERWEKRLVYSKTYDGKIFEATNAGSLQYVTDPVVVYEGDFFEAGDDAGKKYIRYKKTIPRQSTKIVAGFVYKVMPNGEREPYWLDMDDVSRLKAASEKKNKGNANALYTSNGGQIDIGFFATKIVNQALKYVRKSGIASQYEVNGDAGDAAIITNATELPEPDENATYTPSMVVEGPANAKPATVNNISSTDDKEPF